MQPTCRVLPLCFAKSCSWIVFMRKPRKTLFFLNYVFVSFSKFFPLLRKKETIITTQRSNFCSPFPLHFPPVFYTIYLTRFTEECVVIIMSQRFVYTYYTSCSTQDWECPKTGSISCMRSLHKTYIMIIKAQRIESFSQLFSFPSSLRPHRRRLFLVFLLCSSSCAEKCVQPTERKRRKENDESKKLFPFS